MSDPFRRLPSEIRIEVLRHLPLPSVYAATRAFLSLSQTFNTFPTDIVNSATQQYPRSIRRSIRSGITAASLPRSELQLYRFLGLHINEESGPDVPLAALTPALAHWILQKAWQVHWATQDCLKTLAARMDHACHEWTKKGPNEPPAPISWVEEHRVLRAYWRIQLVLDICEPTIKFDCFYSRFRPLLLSSCRVPHQILEWDVVAEYEMQKSIRSETGEKLIEPVASLTEIRFSEVLVQPTWAYPKSVRDGDTGACFYEQDEQYLDFPARGSWYESNLDWHGSPWVLNGQWTSNFLYLGCRLWDKRRMILLGLADTWHNGLGGILPTSNRASGSASLLRRWERTLELGERLRVWDR